MAGTPLIATPFVASATETFHWFSLLVPVGVGLAVAVLTVPEARGGVVAQRVRSLSRPAAALATAGAVVQFFGVAEAGVLPVLQFIGTLLAAVGLVALHSRPSRRLAWSITGIAVLSAVLPDLPLSAVSVNGVAKFLLTTAHVTGALVWIGGLVVLAVVGIMSRRASRAEGADDAAVREWARIWQRFGIAALYSVGAIIISGSWLLWTHVGTVGQMFTTTYGRYLTVKLILVLALLIIGTYNTRILIPNILEAQRDGDTRTVLQLAVNHFPRVVAAEAVTAVGVLVVVPWLHGSARTQAGGPAARPFDLTVFGSGMLLVALVAFVLWAGTRTSRVARPVVAG